MGRSLVPAAAVPVSLLSIAVVALFGVAVAARSASAVAGERRTSESHVTQASYTTGSSGQKLKWLPYRPSSPGAAGKVTPAGHVSRATRTGRVQTAHLAADHPINNPFRDPPAEPKVADLAGTSRDELLKVTPSVEASLGEALPKLAAQEPGLTVETDVTEEMDILDEDRVPTITESLAAGPADVAIKCPSPRDEEYFTPITDITTDISVVGDKDKSPEEKTFPRECPLNDTMFVTTFPRSSAEGCPWPSTLFTWKASGLCHKPLYFEDVHLERYGHSWGPYLQPLISGGHFFLNVPILPYKMGLYPPCECIYTLGYYRPGNCAPYLLDPLPLSVRAGLAEAGVWTGMVFLIP